MGIVYHLYVRGKIKGCFLVTAIVFLVTIFLNICLGWATVILVLFGRNKKKEPDAEETEKPADETPAEDANADAANGENTSEEGK